MAEIVSMGEMVVEIMRKEVGVPLNKAAEFMGPYPSGAPAIYIDAAARLGASTGFIGVLGPDDFGDVVEFRLRDDDVDVSQVLRREGHTTGCAFVSYNPDGSRKFIFHLRYSAAGTLGPEDVDVGWLKGTRLLHLMGSALSVSDSSREACYRAMRIVKDGGGMVSLDPNLRPELLGIDKVRGICAPVLDVCDLVLPSGEEASMLVGVKNAEDACRALLDKAKVVALKMGSEGCKVFTDEEEIFVPPFPIERLMPRVDPTGAGDCFDAGFTTSYVAGKSLVDSARLANTVGAFAITKLGPMEGAPLPADISRTEKQMDWSWE
jgi:sugar/nucleoside kinase (ribokinase family)